jgi:hypothetical protein
MSDRDTSTDARRAQIEALRRMGPERRAALAIELSRSARETALAGIRERDPSLSEEEAQRALFRRLLGEDLYRAAFERAAEC